MNDMTAENRMILPFPEPKQIREPIDEADIESLKKAANLLEEITDDMNSDLEKPFRDELCKVLDQMQERIWKLERANYNPFDMIDYAARVCGIGR
jgi:hypothetical protein